MINYGQSLTWKTNDLVVNIPSIEYRYLWKNYQFLLSLKKDIKILEIWPWAGYFTQFLLDNGFFNIDIVEIDEGFYLSQKQAFRDHKVRVFHSDAVLFLKNSNKEYDLIISRQVIEHFNANTLQEFFHEAHSRLAINWLLVSETINSQNFIYSHFLRHIDITHQCSFSTDLIRQVFNLISNNKNDKLFIGSIHQLNVLDYIRDKFNPKKSWISIFQSTTSNTSTTFVNQKRNNLVSAFLFQLLRDVARILSEQLSLFFFYNRAYQNIGTEFIIFSIKKWEK